MSGKSNPGNYFEDFEIGQVLDHPVARTITEGDCSLYIALTGDRFPLHCNAEFAQSLGYRREVVNDLLVFNIVFGKSVNDISLNAVANLGYADVRFMAPVYPGDTLSALSKVIGKKENSNLKTGNVYVRTQGFNQSGDLILQYYRWVMVRKKLAGEATDEKAIPNLPAEVDAADLPTCPELDLSKFEARATGGRWFWEDYAPGELVHHGSGMTLEESDHMTATRLYQNTAKVHFDQHFMRDSPGSLRLIYGGHIVSVAKALSFNGLENALRILAWNGGAHANPTHAGDTLYAFSEILEKIELPGRTDAGGLRLRLIAVKNQDPEYAPLDVKVMDEETERERYHPNVVLDLDYCVLIPKRDRT